MKKTLLLLFVTLVVIISCNNQKSNKLTAQEIWHKHLETFGDRQHIMNIESAYSITVVESARGMDTMTSYRIKPDKLFNEIKYAEGVEVTFIVNGNKGIFISDSLVEPLNQERIKGSNLMSLLYPELYFEDLGYEITLLEDELINDTAYYKLQLKSPYEVTTTLIDKETFEDVRVYSDNSYMEILETVFIDSCRIVKRMKTMSNSGSVKNYGDVIEFKWNVEIPDSLFDLDRYQIKTY